MSQLNTYQFRLNAPPTMNMYLMILLTSLAGLFALDHIGRKFILVTPGNKEKTELRITGPTGSEVHVSCPAISLSESFIIDNTGLLVVDKFSYFNALTVQMTSSEDVSLHVITGERSKEGYIVFPLAALSTEHILASFTFTQGETTQWLVVAMEDETDITVNYNNSHCKLNEFYTNIDKKLNKFENISGRCTGDITGTFIRSTKPVAVFSRRLCDTESYVHCENHGIMIPPVMHFGKQYVLHVPDIPHVKVSYKVIAALNSTTITQNNGKTFRLCSGCFTIFKVLNPLYISSDKPLLVLTLSEIHKEMSHSSLSILVPVEGFMSSYTVHKEHGKTYMLVLSAGNDVIGSLVSKYDVTPVRIIGCDFSVVTLNLTEPTTMVSLLSPFGAFIYIMEDLLFGFPIGFLFGPNIDVGGAGNDILQPEASQTFQVDTNVQRVMSTTFDYLQSSSSGLSELPVVNVIDQRPWSSHSDDLPSAGTFQEETAQARKVIRRSKYVNQVLNSIKSSNNELDDLFVSTTMAMTNLKATSTPNHVHRSISDTDKFTATKPDTLVTAFASMSNDVLSRYISAISDIDSLVTTSASVIGDIGSRDTKAEGLVASSAAMLNDVESNTVNTSPVTSMTSTPNTIVSSTTGIFQAPSRNGRFRLRSGSILSKILKNSSELPLPSSATSTHMNTSTASSTSLLDKGSHFRNKIISATTSVVSTICTRVCTPFQTNLSKEYLLAAGRKIKEMLFVDRKSLSAQVQKKTSSSDKRLSSTGIGIVGMICILVPVLLAVFSDTINILEKKKRVKSKESTLRRKTIYCRKENDVKDQNDKKYI